MSKIISHTHQASNDGITAVTLRGALWSLQLQLVHKNEVEIKFINVTYVLSAGGRDGRSHIKAGSKQGSTTKDVNMFQSPRTRQGKQRRTCFSLRPRSAAAAEATPAANAGPHRLPPGRSCRALQVELAQKFIKKQPKNSKCNMK